jgi:hypothetical protein
MMMMTMTKNPVTTMARYHLTLILRLPPLTKKCPMAKEAVLTLTLEVKNSGEGHEVEPR